MSALGKILICVLLSISLITCDDSDGSDQLVFAQIVFRHGDRSIQGPYPTDPWGDEKYWPDGYGGLTNVGKRQHYALGKFFRKRYMNFLGSDYSPKKVYISSSDEDRAIMSAAANLAGLFPPKNQQLWNDDLQWQPIPIHTIPKLSDYYIAAHAPCPRYDYLQNVYSDQMYSKYKDSFKKIGDEAGVPIETVNDAATIRENLYIESLKNFTLPEWTKKIYYPGSDLDKFWDEIWPITTSTPEITRLKYGFLWRFILERFDAKIDSKLDPDRKLWFYSAHDTTVSALLNILGLYEKQPPYAAALMFELYKSKDDHYVQLHYKNSTTENHLMSFPNCGTRCSVKKLYELYESSIPTGHFGDGCDLEAIDKSDDSDETTEVPSLLLNLQQN